MVFTTPEGYEATSKHTTANTEKDSDGLVAKIDVTQDDNSIDAGFFPLKNWNPEPPMPEPPTPEKPTPPMPEPPTPEKPTPPMPKQPTPEKPTPPMLEQPTPKAPTPPMVQTPADQQQGKGQMKSSTNKKNQSMSKGEHETAKQLPNTGTSNTSQAGWLMGTLLLTLGTVMIGRKRKKEKTI